MILKVYTDNDCYFSFASLQVLREVLLAPDALEVEDATNTPYRV